MIRIREAVIVEGKYDKIKLSSILDALIITTDGFGIFKDREKLNLIRKLASNRGILILTDSDSAGFVIRNYLTGCIDKRYIKQAYVPQLTGKEKRKESASKEGFLGVEGLDADVIISALERAGVKFKCDGEKREKADERCVTKLDFFKDGLSGGERSAQKRRALLRKLGLPEYLSQNALLDVINTIMTFEQYKSILKETENENAF